MQLRRGWAICLTVTSSGISLEDEDSVREIELLDNELKDIADTDDPFGDGTLVYIAREELPPYLPTLAAAVEMTVKIHHGRADASPTGPGEHRLEVGRIQAGHVSRR